MVCNLEMKHNVERSLSHSASRRLIVLACGRRKASKPKFYHEIHLGSSAHVPIHYWQSLSSAWIQSVDWVRSHNSKSASTQQWRRRECQTGPDDVVVCVNDFDRTNSLVEPHRCYFDCPVLREERSPSFLHSPSCKERP
jgi:hypothetical protein